MADGSKGKVGKVYLKSFLYTCTTVVNEVHIFMGINLLKPYDVVLYIITLLVYYFVMSKLSIVNILIMFFLSWLL